MQQLAERFDVDRISAEARQVELGRSLLTILAAVLYALGWLLAKVVIVLWLIVAWTFTAIRLGWRDAWATHARERVRRQVGPA